MKASNQKKSYDKTDYSPDSLHKSYKELFYSILEKVTPEALDDVDIPPNTADKDLLWDGRYFWEFVKHIHKDDKENFIELLRENEVAYTSLDKIPSKGISIDKAEIAICTSAQIQDIHLDEYIENYVVRCTRKEYDIKSFEGHNKTVINILKKYGIKPHSNDAYIDPFQNRIEKLSIDFFERKYVFEEIEKFLHENSSGFITVRGEGGAGKSAIFANAVKKYSESDEFNCVYYFVSQGTDYDNTINFIECLYEQLDRNYDLSPLKDDYERLSKAWGSLSGAFINRLIKTVALQAKQPLLIVVDALDEISENDMTKQIFQRNLFFIPEELPENLFFLISSRHAKQQNYSGRQLNLSLEKNEPHQKKDIRGYIKNKSVLKEVKDWIKKNKLDAESFTEILCEKSEYRFLYLFYVFQDITGFENIDALPQGIEKFYEKQYARFFSDEKNKEIKKIILAGISHFKPDISLYHLSALCGLKQIKVDAMIENWIAIRLIDEIVSDDISYLKFSHQLFYEFINKHIIELQKLKKSPELFKKLAKRLVKDITIDDETKRIVYEKHHQKKMQVEAIKLIPESLFKSKDMVKLSSYLTNWTFCKEYVSLIEHGEWNIINYINQIVCANVRSKPPSGSIG